METNTSSISLEKTKEEINQQTEREIKRLFFEQISNNCEIIENYENRFTDDVIGGSEIAAIMGLSTFATPMDIYKRKKEGLKQDENKFMKLGKRGEKYTIEDYAEQVNPFVYSLSGIVLKYKKYPHLVASLDAFAYDKETNQFYVVECKNTFKDINSEDDILMEYFLQSQWYMALTGLNFVHLVYSKYLQLYRYFKINRDEEVINHIINYANEWIQKHLIGNTPPEPIKLKDIIEALQIDKKKTIVLPDELSDAAKKVLELDKQIKELEAQKSELKDKIELYAAKENAYYLLDSSGKKIGTFISAERDLIDTEKLKRVFPDVYNQIKKGTTKYAYIKLNSPGV